MCVLISMLFVMAYEIISVINRDRLKFRNNHQGQESCFYFTEQERKQLSAIQKCSDYAVMCESTEWLFNIFHGLRYK